MKITLDIPDEVIAAFLGGIEYTNTGMQMLAYHLGSDDFVDGNTVKLPREKTEV